MLWLYAGTFHFAGMYGMSAVHLVGLLVMAATCVLLFIAARSLRRMGAEDPSILFQRPA